MSGNKIRVGLLFGGASEEHEISIISARNVFEALDKSKYEITPIAIDRQGQWHLAHGIFEKLTSKNPKELKLDIKDSKVLIAPGESKQALVKYTPPVLPACELDVIFPVLHGPNGEDGTVQGLLKLLKIPFVGCGVLSSALCMDKDFTKRILKQAGVPVAKSLSFQVHERHEINYSQITLNLGEVVFVKPANMGSSVGVSKVTSPESFANAVELAFEYDRKILVEEAIEGREVECAVLGNSNPKASVVGEVIPSHEFYSYDAKYMDQNGAQIKIPADITAAEQKQIQNLSIQAFKALDCRGMARVDFFLTDNGAIVNELNTIPGFTSISQYPMLWRASGLGYSELLNELVDLALEDEIG